MRKGYRRLKSALWQALCKVIGYRVVAYVENKPTTHYSMTLRDANEWIHCYGGWPTRLELWAGNRLTACLEVVQGREFIQCHSL